MNFNPLKTTYTVLKCISLVGIAGCVLIFSIFSVNLLPDSILSIWNTKYAAEHIQNSTRILCLIVPTDLRETQSTQRSLRTWATHCDRVLYVSDEMMAEVETILTKPGPKSQIINTSFTYLYNYHLKQFDWFLKVDEHNYIVIENLRHMLKAYSSDDPLIFGYKLKNAQLEPYMFEKSSYVLSREALRRYVEKALPNSTICQYGNDDEMDSNMTTCLRNIGVIAGDSRSSDGSHTFMPYSPSDYFEGLTADKLEWLTKHSFYKVENDTLKLSKNVIAFPNVYGDLKYTLNYFVYNLRIYGAIGTSTNSSSIQFFGIPGRTEKPTEEITPQEEIRPEQEIRPQEEITPQEEIRPEEEITPQEEIRPEEEIRTQEEITPQEEITST